MNYPILTSAAIGFAMVTGALGLACSGDATVASAGPQQVRPEPPLPRPPPPEPRPPIPTPGPTNTGDPGPEKPPTN